MKRLVGVGAVVLLTIAVAVGAVIGLNVRRGPSLVFLVSIDSGGVGVPRAHLGDRWSIGMESTICLDKPGHVELTGVAPMQPDGLRVIGFAVRPNQNWKPTQGTPGYFLGEERASLRHFGFVSRTVDVACERHTAKGYELAVRVLKTTSGPAFASGWVVSYRSPQRAGTLAIPFAIDLCPARVSWAKQCQREGF